MGIPARAARPLVALAIAAASLGCIAHPAYAENATAAVVSDDGSHIVVDVDLNGGASDVGSDRQGAEKGSQGESVSDTETDKTMKAFEGLMTFNVIINNRVLLHVPAVHFRDGHDSPLKRITGPP